MDLPIHVDARGRRWALLTAARVARSLPDHRTWRVVADQVTLPRRSPRDVLTALAELSTPPSDAQHLRFFLRGDEHHLNDFYDVTEHVAAAISPNTPTDAWQYLDRLLGRDVVRTLVLRAPRPTLWTIGLARVCRDSSLELDAEGLLLAADWHPTHQPESTSLPWDPALDETVSDEFPWVFVEGEPSAGARLRLTDRLSDRACGNLRAAAEGLPPEMLLGVAMPVAERRPWFVSPQQLSALGITPVLDVSGSSSEAIRQPEVALRVAEMAAAHRDKVAPCALGRSEEVALRHELEGWGLAPMGVEDRPRAMLTSDAHVDPAVAVVRSYEDGWSHAWNAQTDSLTLAAAEVVSLLVRRGVPCVVTNESGLARDTDGIGRAVVVLAPARSVRQSTVELLRARVEARLPVIVVEPAPHLVEGERSPVLERLLTHRRTRRIGGRLNELDRELVEALAKAHVEGVARLFRRQDGLAPRDARHTALRDGRYLYVTAVHDDSAATDCLLEVRGQYTVERGGSNIWQRWEYWHANGNTYAELEAHPNVVYVFRFDPIHDLA